jgi:hypothetical protein
MARKTKNGKRSVAPPVASVVKNMSQDGGQAAAVMKLREEEEVRNTRKQITPTVVRLCDSERTALL